MGDYHSLQFRAKLTPEALRVVQQLDLEGGWRRCPQVHWVWKWAHDTRADFIPFGALAYAPEEWEHRNELVDGVWDVCCSIKRGDSAHFFLSDVLPHMIEEQCQVWLYDEIDLELCLVLPAKEEHPPKQIEGE